MILAGGKAGDIGIIAPYRAHLRLIRSLLQADGVYADGTCATADIEVETVDRYQGRDKPLIILSCVRSNIHGAVGELLAEKRRLNVALTRAKYRLIIIGSRLTLTTGCPTHARMIQLMEQRGWVMPLSLLSGRAAFVCLKNGVQQSRVELNNTTTSSFWAAPVAHSSVATSSTVAKLCGSAYLATGPSANIPLVLNRVKSDSLPIRTEFSTAGSGRPIAVSAAAAIVASHLLEDGDPDVASGIQKVGLPANMAEGTGNESAFPVSLHGHFGAMPVLPGKKRLGSTPRRPPLMQQNVKPP